MKFDERASQQRMIALANPCEIAEQCNDRRYFFLFHPAQGIDCSIGLTVNVGEE